MMRSPLQRVSATAALLVLAGLAAVGCAAGTTTGTASAPLTTTAAPVLRTIPPARPSTATPVVAPTPVAPATAAAASLEGTVWAGTDSDGDDYVYRFESGGDFGFTSPSGTYTDYDTDHWTQSGNEVDISISDGYSTYHGTIQGDTISGSASNTVGHSWTWTATRQ